MVLAIVLTHIKAHSWKGRLGSIYGKVGPPIVGTPAQCRQCGCFPERAGTSCHQSSFIDDRRQLERVDLAGRRQSWQYLNWPGAQARQSRRYWTAPLQCASISRGGPGTFFLMRWR
jgi:hypothetical protein